MANVRKGLQGVLIVVAFILCASRAMVCHRYPTSPSAIHRIRLIVLAAAVEEYAANAGRLPATLDELPSPALPEPGCIDSEKQRPRDDYRRDPDGVRLDYRIVDARSLRFRIEIPGHTTKAGAWVPNTHIEESAMHPIAP